MDYTTSAFWTSRPSTARHTAWAVVADDLTGAADAALAFHEHGMETDLRLAVPHRLSLPQEPRVVALDTETRHRAPDAAARQVAQAITRLQRGGIAHFYKKIDSTLRGNIGAEVAAALAASPAAQAIVCPAFPALGRTVIAGRVQVNGRDLLDAPGADDPRTPVVSSRIAAVLAQQSGLPIVEYARPEDLLASEWTGGTSSARIVVADAASDAALRRWVELVGLAPEVLWVGAAGLAHHVASLLAPTAPRRSPRDSEAGRADRATTGRPVLVVVGSMHAAATAQRAALQQRADVTALVISPAQMVREPLDAAATAAKLAQAIQRGTHVLLGVEASPEARDELRATLAAIGRDGPWAGPRITAWLGSTVAAVVAQAPALTDYVLTGGDTAHAVITRLGINHLRLVGRVAPGVPISESEERRLRFVTKAGGFGTEDVLVRAVEALIMRERGEL